MLVIVRKVLHGALNVANTEKKSVYYFPHLILYARKKEKFKFVYKGNDFNI